MASIRTGNNRRRAAHAKARRRAMDWRNRVDPSIIAYLESRIDGYKVEMLSITAMPTPASFEIASRLVDQAAAMSPQEAADFLAGTGVTAPRT